MFKMMAGSSEKPAAEAAAEKPAAHGEAEAKGGGHGAVDRDRRHCRPGSLHRQSR